uniref:marine proteobacterial sortase target protein n=1 Tax=Ningiella ruwaisensis TaxID=2364274 RepID=UPI00109F3BD8|nr:marine proteobacterial sortase target protein [Ningiella ruwaisensis]
MTNTKKIMLVLAAASIIAVVSAFESAISQASNSAYSLINKKSAAERHDLQNSASNIDEKNTIKALINLGDNGTEHHITQAHIINNIYASGRGGFYLQSDSGQAAKDDENAPPSWLAAKLEKSEFDVSVSGNIARTRVTQHFTNPSNKWQHGTFVFPLPEDAAVDAMLMQIGTRKIEGVIKQKEEAKKAFEKAKQAGNSASLVNQLRPNLFVNKVANIAPNTAIIVTIEYQQVLSNEGRRYSLVIPTAITPRYSPHARATENQDLLHSLSGEADEESTSIEMALVDTKLDIKLNINMASDLFDFESEHHEIDVAYLNDDSYQIRLQNASASSQNLTKTLAKDFVLNWTLGELAQPQASHVVQQVGDYDYGIIQVLPPKASLIGAARDLTFILDTSGSMVGDSIEQAKSAIFTAINDLKANERFNIIEFNSRSRALFQSEQAATVENKQKAKSFINSLQASGGTEMKDALELAFSLRNKRPESLHQILFITDGSVSNEAQLIQLIANNLEQSRLFTVGIGSAPNAYFMSEAAIAGRGTFTLIGDLSTVEEKMQRLLDKIKRPVLSDIQLVSANKLASAPEIYPRIIPDVYANEPIDIVYRQKRIDSGDQHNAGFYLQANWHSNLHADEQDILWKSALPAKTISYQSGIDKHWGYQKIRSIEREFALRSQKPGHGQGEAYLTLKQQTEKAITETALAFQLVSQYTSLLAIDEQNHKPSAEYLAMLKNTQQDLSDLQTQTWRAAQVSLPQTATPSALLVISGALVLGLSLLFKLLTGFRVLTLKVNR